MIGCDDLTLVRIDKSTVVGGQNDRGMTGDSFAFQFLENAPKMMVDIAQVRDAYLDRAHRYLDQLRAGCTNQGADYFLFDTKTDVRDALLKRSVRQ